MANIVMGIEFTSETMAQLIAGTRRNGSKIWAGRVMAHAAMISREIGNMLIKIFNDTPVIKSMKGQGEIDLSAHLGLSSKMASALIDGMTELIRSSVGIISQNINDDTMLIKIRAVKKDWDEYLSLPYAQYISHPSNIAIPVMRWLLIDPNIDIGQAAYDIVFKGENQKFDVRIQKVSRSRRAIMVSLETLGGTGGYVLPSIISGQVGQNFIEYAIGQPDVAQKAAGILMKKVG